MINFVIYKSNYCLICLARMKDVAAKKFEHFMACFKRKFERSIAVIRTYGGGEHQNVDIFCIKTKIERQMGEAEFKP